MSYPVNPGIPAAGTSPAASRAIMQSNFNNLVGAFMVDHVSYNATSGSGWHQQVTFNEPYASTPSPLPTNPQAVLYTQTVSGEEQLYFTNSEGSTYAITPPVTGTVPFSIARFNINLANPTPYTIAAGSTNIASVSRATSSSQVHAIITFASPLPATFAYTYAIQNSFIGASAPLLTSIGFTSTTAAIYFYNIDGTSGAASSPDSRVPSFSLTVWSLS